MEGVELVNQPLIVHFQTSRIFPIIQNYNSSQINALCENLKLFTIIQSNNLNRKALGHMTVELDAIFYE